MPAFNRTTTPCLICEAPVSATVSMRERGKGRYCSPVCHKASRIFRVERDFHPRVDRSGGPDACWPWMGYCNPQTGYGVVHCDGRAVGAHVLAWEIANDRTVPYGLLVRHLCPGGSMRHCCNPGHLAAGTVQDNSDDAIREGRVPRGIHHPRVKLTEAQVIEMRCRHAGGESVKGMAKAGLFPVTASTIDRIVKRRIWVHLP